MVTALAELLSARPVSIAARLHLLVPGIGPGTIPRRTHDEKPVGVRRHIAAASDRVRIGGQLSFAGVMVMLPDGYANNQDR